MVTISKMREQLLEGFPEQQADLMARVFVSAHDELVTKAEFNELTAVVRELAEAQQRTELRVEELAEAQQRTEFRVEELAEAQRELAAAQKQTEWAVRDLAKQVGGLSNALGGSLEDFACDLVPELLEKHWQMQIESAVRGTIAGKPVVVVCEAKASVSLKEVEGFLAVIDRFRSAHPDDDIRPLFFGYKADRKARQKIIASGAAMVFTRGVMIPAAA